MRAELATRVRGDHAHRRSPSSARYVSTTVDGDDAPTIAAQLARARARRSRDPARRRSGRTATTWRFELDGREAGSFASQGQLRAIMLAWKTAELAVLARAHGDSPILLLDDVSSELDPQRNEYLFEHLATLAGQCFITTTHREPRFAASSTAPITASQDGQIL